ncbi:STAS domain-containing protein [Pigmentibacter sp. JX0631]|uniref:STAS domain-containing protein n=1 Tax=Pigmentibacter sp. JX0631 TaxID=2976982 RepID=UPI002468A599|nr:STAS domain-containing protein [Pigmentibacter sp. JX0631]WGL60024.1 STAS domain-containing protein [Pigmentibacter sp. JX0631]
MLQIEHSLNNDMQSFNCSGSLDLESFENFDQYFFGNYNKNIEKTVINLKNVNYISSVGLRSLLRCAKQVYSDKNKIFLKVENEMVKNIITLSGFCKILPFLED